MSVTAYGALPGNLLTLNDQSFETGAGTWTASALAGSVAQVSSRSFEGTGSLQWTSTGNGTSSVISGSYPAKAGLPYVASGYIWLAVPVVVTLSLKWSGGTTSAGPSVISQFAGAGWNPVTVAAVAPAGTTGVQLIASFLSTSGQNAGLDLCYIAQSASQVLVDWVNPAFTPASGSGNAFADLTPFVMIQDSNIAMTHGRQDAISEVQNGSLTFQVDNPLGWFTQGKSTSPWFPSVSLGARTQWNVSYLTGVAGVYGSFVTRFDGAVNELDYDVAVNGTYSTAQFNCRDVIGYLSNQPNLSSWTKQRVLLDNPLYHWTLDDPTGSKMAAESSGNKGPALVQRTYGVDAAGSFGDGSGVTETQADALAGTPGPLAASSPLPSYYMTCAPAASGVIGLGSAPLVGHLPTPLAVQSEWWLEWWAVFDPAATSEYTATNTARMGMIQLQDGSTTSLQAWVIQSGTSQTVSGGVYTITNPWTGVTTNEGNFAGSTAVRWSATDPVPYHYAIVCNNGTFTLYENGVSLGNLTPTNITSLGYASFNQIMVGQAGSGAAQGLGGFAGNISLVSIYEGLPAAGAITAHYGMGWDGMYGALSGAVVAQLAAFASLPSFWLSSTLSTHGLSAVDYYTAVGQNPLTAMQQAEAAESGLLYAPSSGKLSFDGRDVRMGCGAPSVSLPMGSFDPDLGHKVTDQYVQTSTVVLGYNGPTIASSDAGNETDLGNYPNGDFQSPRQIPVLTVAPANPVPGQFLPYAQDTADWGVNRNSNPPFKAAGVKVSLLSMTNPSDAEFIAPSTLAAVDVNSTITLTPAVSVVSLPDIVGALDFFVEGVTETFGLQIHDLSFYTSPVNASRCWIPGDPVYGVLSSTAVVGVSQEGTSRPASAALNAFDPGGPWFTPAFSASMNKNQGASGYVGASDLRGIAWQLGVMLSPPLFVGTVAAGGTIGSTWTIPLGVTPMIDTYNGYGTNAYVVQVAGFYEVCVAVNLPTPMPANYDMAFLRVVCGDTRLGTTFSAGQSDGSTFGSAGESLWVRTRFYAGVGSLIYPEVWQQSATALGEVAVSIEFTGFGPNPD